jgi:hypothetical protein
VELAWRVVAIIGGVGWFGCAPDLDPRIGEFVARGEHVEVWASEGLEVCGGNVELMDRFVKRFREEVGPRPEAEALHRYHVLDEDDWAELAEIGVCPEDAGGCTVERRTVYARVGIPSLHELVHAEIYGEHDSYLEEGIAELYGCPKLGGMPGERSVEAGLDIRGAYIPHGDYARAAHFSRFIVDRHGIDGFLRVRDSTSTESDHGSVSRAFESRLGVSLDAELERYAETSEPCLDAGYRIALLECELPASPWREEDGGFELTVDLACDSPEVFGPFRDEIFGLGAMEIEEHGVYDIELDAPGTEEAVAWITACDSGCAAAPRAARASVVEPGFTVVAKGGQRVSQRLRPGKYWLRLARPIDAPGVASLRVSKRSVGRAEPTRGE